MSGISTLSSNVDNRNVTNERRGLDRFQTRVLLIIGWTLLISAIVAIFIFGRDLILLTFAGVLAANFFYRLVGESDRWFDISHKFRLAFFMLFLTLFSAAFAYFMGQRAFSQIDELSGQITAAYETTIQKVESTALGQRIISYMPDESSGGTTIVNRVTSWFKSSFGFLIDLLVLIVVALYLMFSPALYIDGLVKLTPPPHRSWFRQLLDENGEVLYRWVIGRLASMSVVAVLVALSLWWLGLPMPFLLGLFAGLACFVPNIGPFIGIAPAMLLAIQQGQSTVLWVAGVYVIIQTVESYLLTPLIQQHQVAVPPALVIITQVLAGTLFGFWGIALATPLLATLMLWTKRIYIESFLEQHWSTSTRSVPR